MTLILVHDTAFQDVLQFSRRLAALAEFAFLELFEKPLERLDIVGVRKALQDRHRYHLLRGVTGLLVDMLGVKPFLDDLGDILCLHLLMLLGLGVEYPVDDGFPFLLFLTHLEQPPQRHDDRLIQRHFRGRLGIQEIQGDTEDDQRSQIKYDDKYIHGFILSPQ